MVWMMLRRFIKSVVGSSVMCLALTAAASAQAIDVVNPDPNPPFENPTFTTAGGAAADYLSTAGASGSWSGGANIATTATYTSGTVGTVFGAFQATVATVVGASYDINFRFNHNDNTFLQRLSFLYGTAADIDANRNLTIGTEATGLGFIHFREGFVATSASTVFTFIVGVASGTAASWTIQNFAVTTPEIDASKATIPVAVMLGACLLAYDRRKYFVLSKAVG
ncbi:hypothetical protein IV102_19620 [bacterium]|nr:hypothetical protein [bacterium]